MDLGKGSHIEGRTGEIEVDVQYHAVTVYYSQALLGQDFLRKIRLDCMHGLKLVNRVDDANPALTTLLERYKAVFKNELGTVRTHHAKLHLRGIATPTPTDSFCYQGYHRNRARQAGGSWNCNGPPQL